MEGQKGGKEGRSSKGGRQGVIKRRKRAIDKGKEER